MKRVSMLLGRPAVLAALSGLLAGMLAGCGGSSLVAGTPSTQVAEAKVALPEGSIEVRYELTGTAVNIDGTYAEPADGKEKMVELRATALPWRKSFVLSRDKLFVAGLVAHGPNLESTVTCKIFKNDTVIAQETGPTVECRADIP